MKHKVSLPETEFFPMALKVADGRGICHRQKTRFADGKVEPSEKLLLPMAGPSATKAHRQPSSLPVARPSATKSHRPRIFLPMAGPSADLPHRQNLPGADGGRRRHVCRWPRLTADHGHVAAWGAPRPTLFADGRPSA